MAAREAELADLVAARRAISRPIESRLARQTEEIRNRRRRRFEIQSKQLGRREKMLPRSRRSERAADRRERTGIPAARLRDSLNDLRDLRGKQEVRQTQLQLRIENLVEHVMRRYQVDLRDFHDG